MDSNYELSEDSIEDVVTCHFQLQLILHTQGRKPQTFDLPNLVGHQDTHGSGEFFGKNSTKNAVF